MRAPEVRLNTLYRSEIARPGTRESTQPLAPAIYGACDPGQEAGIHTIKVPGSRKFALASQWVRSHCITMCITMVLSRLRPGRFRFPPDLRRVNCARLSGGDSKYA
jgi:hypothetical protein